MEALADILADALLADLEADLESEERPSLTQPTAQSPTGLDSRTARSFGSAGAGGAATAA
jgi:hypothetical protein